MDLKQQATIDKVRIILVETLLMALEFADCWFHMFVDLKSEVSPVFLPVSIYECCTLHVSTCSSLSAISQLAPVAFWTNNSLGRKV